MSEGIEVKVDLENIQNIIWGETVNNFSLKELISWKNNVIWQLDILIAEEENKLIPKVDIYLLNDINNLLKSINFTEGED